MGSSEALFIAQIVVLLLVGRVLGEAMQRVGQPAVRRCSRRRANRERCSRQFPISVSLCSCC